MMKFFILFFTLAITLLGAEIDEFASDMGYYRDYAKALEQAKKEDKVIMLVLVGDYCPWCRKFERQTLKREIIAMHINQNFVPLIVDRNLDENNYPSKYYSPRIPSVSFIEPKKESKIFESLGYLQKDEYKEILDQTLAKYKEMKQ